MFSAQLSAHVQLERIRSRSLATRRFGGYGQAPRFFSTHGTATSAVGDLVPPESLIESAHGLAVSGAQCRDTERISYADGIQARCTGGFFSLSYLCIADHSTLHWTDILVPRPSACTRQLFTRDHPVDHVGCFSFFSENFPYGLINSQTPSLDPAWEDCGRAEAAHRQPDGSN